MQYVRITENTVEKILFIENLHPEGGVLYLGGRMVTPENGYPLHVGEIMYWRYKIQKPIIFGRFSDADPEWLV